LFCRQTFTHKQALNHSHDCHPTKEDFINIPKEEKDSKRWVFLTKTFVGMKDNEIGHDNLFFHDWWK
jgi:hypothetical protein